jgi:hypothetical protein
MKGISSGSMISRCDIGSVEISVWFGWSEVGETGDGRREEKRGNEPRKTGLQVCPESTTNMLAKLMCRAVSGVKTRTERFCEGT